MSKGDIQRDRRVAAVAGLAAVALATAACNRADAPGASNEISPAAEQNELIEAAEANAAVLAQDEELANDAAADEAADMEIFGGNAAAGETGNASEPAAAGKAQ